MHRRQLEKIHIFYNDAYFQQFHKRGSVAEWWRARICEGALARFSRGMFEIGVHGFESHWGSILLFFPRHFFWHFLICVYIISKYSNKYVYLLIIFIYWVYVKQSQPLQSVFIIEYVEYQKRLHSWFIKPRENHSYFFL